MSDADLLLTELRAHAQLQSRIGIDLVWDAFRRVVRGYTGSVEARPRLAELLTELAAADAIVLPRGRTSWRTEAAPPLPSWVRVRSEPCANPPRVDHRALAWPPELAFVTRMRHAPLLDDLVAIRAFFAGGGREAELVPLRERSLEIFGDEKRLDVLRLSVLFRSGQLSNQLLRCFEVAPPLVWEAAGAPADGGSVLVVENLHTYESFKRWNARTRAYAAIAYGHGSEFNATVRDLPRVCLALGTEQAEYFGDLDYEGLQIPVYAGAVLRREGAAIRLTPAVRWYEALLSRIECARPTRSAAEAELAVVAWLPEAMRAVVRDLLARGTRLPQELVGTRLLATLAR